MTLALRLTMYMMIVALTAAGVPSALRAQSAASVSSDRAAAALDRAGADPQKLQLFCRLNEVWKKTANAYRERPVISFSVGGRERQKQQNQIDMLRELGAIQAEEREIAAQIGPDFEEAWSLWPIIGNLPEAGNFRVAMFKLLGACEPKPSKDPANR